MDKGILSPIEIKYDGLDARLNVVDGVYFGKSIQGTAQLYNHVIYLFENGDLPSSRSKYRTRIYAGVPEKGSLSLGAISMMAAGEMALHPQLWGVMADWLIPEIIKAVWLKLLNKPDKMMQVIEFIHKESQENRAYAKELAQMTIGAVVSDKNRLLDIVEKLALSNKQNSRNIVEPIGKSCSTLSHKNGNGEKIIEVDVAEAEVIRSKDELQVTDLAEYTCYMEAVDKTNGSCRILLVGDERPIIGKIDDPSLQVTGNIYTNALDQNFAITIKAKTTIKDGVVQKFFISDARK